LIQILHIDHLKQQFAYWCGSHKLKLYITASIFHSIRLVVYLATSASANWSVCPYRVLEIQGSTEVSFLVPYMAQYAMTTTNSTDFIYSVYVQILSWSQSDNSVSAPIYINAYKSAASDFQVAGPLDLVYILQSGEYECQSAPREEFNQDFEPFQEGMTGYALENLVCGERIETWRQMLHKLTPIFITNGNGGDYPVQFSRISGQVLVGSDMIALFYRFWRGSVRYKFMTLKSAVHYANFTHQNPASIVTTPFQGIAIGAPNLNSCEGEVPYYSPALFEMTGSTPLYTRKVQYAGNGNTYMLKGCGDDFSFHWLQLPQAGVYANPPTNYGTTGLSAFF